jgi:putative MATE family efflux protein
MVLEMVMESVFAVSDVFFVSRLGASAVATVGLTESMLTIVYTVAIGLSIGITATVARRIGEKDPDRAAAAAVQGIIMGAIVAVAIGALGLLLAPTLLGVMGASPEVLRIGSRYTRVMLGGNVTVVMLFLINAIFRGAGDAAIAMRVLWLANAVNIVLGPCLVFGVGPFPKLGVTGAAVGTTIGRGIGVLFQLSQLRRRDGRVMIRRHHLRVDLPLMGSILKLSSSALFQTLVGTASWIGLIRVLASFGSAALAGYTIGIRIILFALFPSWGVSNAAATMVGQALGARRPERAERAVWQAGFYNMIALSLVAVVFVTAAGPLVSVFTRDPEVARFAASCLRTISFGFPFYAYGMVLTQSFNGAGDTVTPTWINLFCFWLWEIPLAYFLAVHAGIGPYGVFISIAVAFSTLALVSAVIFRQGRWKLQQV